MTRDRTLSFLLNGGLTLIWFTAYLFMGLTLRLVRRGRATAERHRDRYRDALAALHELTDADPSFTDPVKEPDSYAANFTAGLVLRDPDWYEKEYGKRV